MDRNNIIVYIIKLCISLKYIVITVLNFLIYSFPQVNHQANQNIHITK